MITHSTDSEANHHNSIMSSFLMNTAGSYGADPKFLSSPEDYNSAQAQAAMASTGYMAHGDYYSHQAAAHYPGYPATSMGIPGSHQGAAAAGLSGYGRGTDWGSGYYQQCSAVGMQQQMLQHQMMQAAGHLSPLNHTSTGSHLSGAARSPVSSPQPQGHNLASNNVLNHGGNHDGNGNSLCGNSASAGSGGNGGSGSNGEQDGYPSPQHPGIAQPQLTPGGGDGGMSSDCSDDESSPQSNRQMPVVYPWMKKIHVGGVGKDI